DACVPRNSASLAIACGYRTPTQWLPCYTDRRTFLGVDYDEHKIRVARRTAPDHPRIHFEKQDLLNWEYPACDTILLLDVLHYWTPEKQQWILSQARRAVRPGGRLVLREAARAESGEHRRVDFGEVIATRLWPHRAEGG